jgi:hypothetical protein
MVAASVWVGSACNFSWDVFDPRLTGGAGGVGGVATASLGPEKENKKIVKSSKSS